MSDYSSGAIHDGALFDTANVSPQELAELSKALEAGNLTGQGLVGQNSNGGALKVESLENTLKILQYKESDIVFWKMINKAPAYNTVEEFNQLLSYGADRGGFNNEGELPEEEDSTYRRAAEHVKFLGVTKSVTHPMQLVRIQPGVGQIMQREIKNGTLWIMRKADRALAFANASLIPQEFNGLYAQHYNAFTGIQAYHTSESVVDLRGAALTENVVMEAANSVINNHGYADTLIGPPVVINDFAKAYGDKKRIIVNSDGVESATVGQALKNVQTQFGKIELVYDKFLRTGPFKQQSTLADGSKAPAVPIIGGSPITVVTGDTLSRFASTDAGAYYYAVAAVNRYGESSLLLLNSGAAQAIAAGEVVDLQFTDGGGAYAATSYTIYRSTKNAAGAIGDVKFFPLFSISTAELSTGYDGAAAGGKVRDRNRWLADCQQAIFIENDPEIYEFKQLAPLMKMDLAVLSPATRFMILLYGTPQLYAPKKMVRFINIGRYSA
ncbi:MAG: hypothetical protein JHC54_11280 [Acinetobacter sp.]|nr:hypothetical protein [Acinetobacter sp.]